MTTSSPLDRHRANCTADVGSFPTAGRLQPLPVRVLTLYSGLALREIQSREGQATVASVRLCGGAVVIISHTLR